MKQLITKHDLISVKTLHNYVKSLTSGPIKALSGLDDTKEIKERTSFEDLRILTKKYCQESLRTKVLLEQIDTTEMFYQTNFGSHLEKNSDHACACLTCVYSISISNAL